MKLRQFFKTLTMLLLVLTLCPAFSALAYQPIDTGQETALTVYFGKDGVHFSGAEFQLYRVADVSSSAQFTLTGDFSRYPVSLKELDSAGWRALAQTLEAYAARDKLTPLHTAITGKNGRAEFSSLTTGLYLVTGQRYESQGYTYTPQPFLIALPSLTDENSWKYTMAVSCKYDSDSNTEEDTIERKVLKVWRDDGNEEKRPEQIVVQLLRDGEVYDTVTLSNDNNWRYTWPELSADHHWQVVEHRTPEDYTVLIEREGITFVMTNTCLQDIPDTPPPGDNTPPDSNTPPDDNTPPEEHIPDEPPPQGGLFPPVEEEILDDPVPRSPGQAILPQTGVLWWPVPLLACSGLLLFLTGWGKRRKYEQHQS